MHLHGALKRTIATLATGKLSHCPFPQEASERLRAALRRVCASNWLAWAPQAEAQDQPIDLRLLSAFLSSCGDPDVAILRTYDVGVPIGLGVELPRTPLVFPEKHKWSIQEQETWGGDSEQAQSFIGVDRDNYPSAHLYDEALEEALEEQVQKGHAFKLTELAARKQYGDQ